MKQKRVLLIFLIIAVLLVPALAFADESEAIDKAYSCLEDRLGGDCGDTSSTEQAAFSLLAGAYDSSVKADCKSSLNTKKDDDCWGARKDASCDLKSTALAVLALDRAGSGVTDSIDWLLSKRKLVDEFDWYIEIDSINKITCEISKNDGSERTFEVGENKKITGSSSCLEPAENNYFLKIDEDCLEDNFTISCDENFITTLLYKTPGSSTIHVSSDTHNAPAEGETEERVNAYCFTDSNDCDYEGTLWATLALEKYGEETSVYLAYLDALSDESTYKKLLPSAFLYLITHEEDYYSKLINEQKPGNYWDLSNEGKFYDTALAILGMSDSDNARESAKEYLIENQDDTGCWNSNTRDTAFVLYSGWPKTPATGPISRPPCIDPGYDYFCVPSGSCDSPLTNFNCDLLGEECCETDFVEQTCNQKGGEICDDDEICEGNAMSHLGTGVCCDGTCEPDEPKENLCEKNSYTCKFPCDSGEVEKVSYSNYCDFGDFCCGKKESKAFPWLLVILLIILIILVVLAIIFRNQLKIWWFKFKTRFKSGKGPSQTKRPPMLPPGGIPQLHRPRQIIPRQAMPMRMPMRRGPMPGRPGQRREPEKPEKDKDFEETMKKLRDMAK